MKSFIEGLLSTFLLATFVFFGISCQTSSNNSDDSQASASNSSTKWKSQMQMLRYDFQELAPYLYSDDHFFDKKNHKQILGKIEAFKKHSHEVGTSTDFPDQDPSLQIMSEHLKSNIELGINSFKDNRKDYAQAILKETLNQCFHCHTRNDKGIQQGPMDIKKDFAWSTPLDQAEYLVAFRQFDTAIDVLVKTLNKPEIHKTQPLLAENAARKLLAIVVRVKNDPKLTLKKINLISSHHFISANLKESLKVWERAALRWSNQESVDKDKYLEAAETLLNRGKNVRAQSGDLAADFYFLRATSYLHDFLSHSKDRNKKAAALFLLGNAYEALRDIGFWNLHEVYFEKCIYTNPHSSVSKKCYDAWDQSVLVGYSGSAGTFIPKSVSEKKKKLEKMAK